LEGKDFSKLQLLKAVADTAAELVAGDAVVSVAVAAVAAVVVMLGGVETLVQAFLKCQRGVKQWWSKVILSFSRDRLAW